MSGINVEFNADSGAWTDGRHYVKSELIRKHTVESTGRKSNRGRLARTEVSNYWLDKYGVLANVR